MKGVAAVKHEFLGARFTRWLAGRRNTPRLRPRSSVFSSRNFAVVDAVRTMRTCASVRVPVLATYPDVTVICGPTERDETDLQAVTNPALIIEVLSRSTEEYDAGDKFEHYKTLPSLRQYVLVSHRERSLEVWTLADAGEAGDTRCS